MSTPVSKDLFKDTDIVISFDTTGSMYSVLGSVRRKAEAFVHSFMGISDGIRIGIIAHGDYCDEGHPYTIRALDLCRDEQAITKFIRETQSTCGGDADECYELVLNVANEVMSWGDGRKKYLIVIGDSNPHSPSYHLNTKHLNWEAEAFNLASKGVQIFGVHALPAYRNSSASFYKRISSVTNGVYLTLDQFEDIEYILKATYFSQSGNEEELNNYVTVIRDSGNMTRSIQNNIYRLKGEYDKVEDIEYSYGCSSRRRYTYKPTTISHTDATEVQADGLLPIAPGRFQVMEVDKDTCIKDFVESAGIKFEKGRGFYELSKGETIQQYKEVILQNIHTGEVFNGAEVRKMLHLQPQIAKGGVKERLNSKTGHIDEYRVFVQSTSVNRKLIHGTKFLYEVNDIDVAPEATIDVVPEVVPKSDEPVKVTSDEIIATPVPVTTTSTTTKTRSKKSTKKKSKALKDRDKKSKEDELFSGSEDILMDPELHKEVSSDATLSKVETNSLEPINSENKGKASKKKLTHEQKKEMLYKSVDELVAAYKTRSNRKRNEASENIKSLLSELYNIEF